MNYILPDSSTWCPDRLGQCEACYHGNGEEGEDPINVMWVDDDWYLCASCVKEYFRLEKETS